MLQSFMFIKEESYVIEEMQNKSKKEELWQKESICICLNQIPIEVNFLLGERM